MPVLDGVVDDVFPLRGPADDALPLLRQQPQFLFESLGVLHLSCPHHLLSVTDDGMENLLVAVHLTLKFLVDTHANS